MNWIKNLFADNYYEGYADGYMQACKTLYEREQRRRNHDPEKCEMCRPRESRACTCQREASQEA